LSRILIIKTSLRTKSNSDILAEQVAAGAEAEGHQVE
jgi:multimeric flavodoxin WrbA